MFVTLLSVTIVSAEIVNDLSSLKKFITLNAKTLGTADRNEVSPNMRTEAVYSNGYVTVSTYIGTTCPSTGATATVSTYYGNCEKNPIDQTYFISQVDLASCGTTKTGIQTTVYSDSGCTQILGEPTTSSNRFESGCASSGNIATNVICGSSVTRTVSFPYCSLKVFPYSSCKLTPVTTTTIPATNCAAIPGGTSMKCSYNSMTSVVTLYTYSDAVCESKNATDVITISNVCISGAMASYYSSDAGTVKVGVVLTSILSVIMSYMLFSCN